MWCIACGEDGDPTGSCHIRTAKNVIYSWKLSRNNKGSTFVTHNECLNICVASLLKTCGVSERCPQWWCDWDKFLSAKLKEQKRDGHRNLCNTSRAEKEASFHPVHSSRLLTTSNHRHHYRHPYPLITSHPSTMGSWGSHALTPAGIKGQCKCLGWNWVFRHASVISPWTSELQTEPWGRKSDAFSRGWHTSFQANALLLAKAEAKRQAQNKKRSKDEEVFFIKSGRPEPNVVSREAGGVGAVSRLEDSVDKQIQRGPVSTLQLCKDNEH